MSSLRGKRVKLQFKVCVKLCAAAPSSSQFTNLLPRNDRNPHLAIAVPYEEKLRWYTAGNPSQQSNRKLLKQEYSGFKPAGQLGPFCGKLACSSRVWRDVLLLCISKQEGKSCLCMLCWAQFVLIKMFATSHMWLQLSSEHVVPIVKCWFIYWVFPFSIKNTSSM